MSKMGFHASLYIFEKVPSEYIPFKGNLPVLDVCHKKEYMELVQNKIYVEECPDWAQEATNIGEFIFTLENNFKEYLKSVGKLDEWGKMKSPDKATELVKFLDSQSLGLSSLEI